MTRYTTPVEACLGFFEKAVPNPTDKNRATQLGCHCEEVVEMLDELTPLTPFATDLLKAAHTSMHQLANYLKANDDKFAIKDRVKFLDALCDQKVTAIGVAYMNNMDVAGAFDEVNRSNLSKFGPDGEPIFNENQKVMKGPDYSPAELAVFV